MASISIDRNGFLANVFLARKGPCRAASTAALTLSGEQTVDGVALVAEDRVLVKNQSSSVDNGIYVVKTGEWERADDFNQRGHATKGTEVRVTDGTTNALSEWYVSTAGDPVPGQEAITFAQFSASEISSLTPTDGYAIIGNGTTWTAAGFLQSGSGATTRTWQAKARDIVSVTDWGAVGDGTTDDTTAVTNADADTRAKLSPPGLIFDTTLAATDLDGPYHGWGQIRDSSDNKRAPWFSAVKAPPSSFGNHDSVSTAFNGDLSKVQIAMEHRITGTTTLGQPATGYRADPETSPIYLNLFNSSGHNESTSTNDGRTAARAIRLQLANTGQGDCVGIHVSGVVSSTRAGSTNFLANPAVTVIDSSLFAGADGVLLNTGEMQLHDQGFDVAALGWNIVLDRNDDTGAKDVFWAAFRAHSNGTAPPDMAFTAVGAFDYGLDLTGGTFTDNAAIALEANQRIYGNAIADGSGALGAPTSHGTDWIDYDTGISGWRVVVANSAVFQVTSTQVTATQQLLASGAANMLRVVNTTDNASVQVARFEGDRATMADNDEAYLSLMLSPDNGTQTEFGRITWVATDVNVATSIDGRIDFAVVTAGTLADEMQLDGTALSPSTSDGLALGTTLNMWSDVFIASGGVVSFNAGDVTITHSANTLTVSGGVLAAPINLFTVASVNFNSANTDTSLTIALPSGYTRYRISNVVISGASASLTTATFGLFTASGGGGTAIIASGTAITVSTASEGTNNNMQTTAPTNVNTQSQNESTLFFRVITPQGSAATATVSINYTPVS